MSAVVIKQLGDGTDVHQNTADAVDDLVLGGPASPSSTSPRYTTRRIAKLPVNAGADTGGGLLAWANPHSYSILIERITLDITTKTTGTCTIDVGVTSTSATSSVDNLIDGLDGNTAVVVADNITDKGSNGKSRQKLASGKWITATASTGTSTGLVAYAYVEYLPAT